MEDAFHGSRYGAYALLFPNTIDRLDAITFAQWAERFAPHGSFKHMEPGISGLTFTPSTLVSAKVMLNWMRKVSSSADTARVGFAKGGLRDIWADRCVA